MAKNMNESLAMSGIKTRIVHGVEIKKMPIRAYMNFAAKGGTLVDALLNTLFPGKSGVEVLTGVLSLDRDALVTLLTRLLVEAPEPLFDALAALLGVEVGALLDNPEIGPSELWDVLEAWSGVNDLTDFFGRVSAQFRRP